MTNTTQWEVSRYGQLIERGDIGVITTKIYKYQGKYYIELWKNGRNIHFSDISKLERR